MERRTSENLHKIHPVPSVFNGKLKKARMKVDYSIGEWLTIDC